MTIEFDVTEQDCIDFNLFHLGHSKGEKRTSFLLRFLPPISFLFCGFVMLPVMIVVSVLWIILYPKFHKKITTNIINNLLKKHRLRFVYVSAFTRQLNKMENRISTYAKS